MKDPGKLRGLPRLSGSRWPLRYLPKWAAVVDPLLLLSIVLFLWPLDPWFSSIPAVVWVLFQLLVAPVQRRWAAWPMVFVLLLFSRSWWLNQMPHPVAAQDGVLVAGALLAGACVAPQRW